MLRFYAVLALAAAVGFGPQSGAFAQTTPPATEEPAPAESPETTETTPPAENIEDKLTFADEDGEGKVGQPYTREVIGAWEMRCIKGEEGAEADEPCQMYQLMDDGEGVPVGEMSLFRLPGTGKAEAGATIVVPLETALPNQVTIAIDGGKARRYPYAFCNPVGCYARLGLTKEDVAAFKGGKEAIITIVPALAPDQKVNLAMSLEGFTASYAKVSVIEQ